MESEGKSELIILRVESSIGRAAALAIIAQDSSHPFPLVREKLSDYSTEALEQAAQFLGSPLIAVSEPEPPIGRFKEILSQAFNPNESQNMKLPARKPFYLKFIGRKHRRR